jgi:hypothetical protein
VARHCKWGSSAVLGTVVVLSCLVGFSPGQSGAAAPPVIAYPNLRVEMPTSDISISTPSTGVRTLDFEHITWDAGPGPLVFTPKLDTNTGTSTATQELYTLTGTKTWAPVKSVPVVGHMTWEPPFDYRFPLTSFGLYSVSDTGGVGSLVATSPKVDFCMTPDTYVGGVHHTAPSASPPATDCTNPDGALGLSVGWGDEYDYTDAGNNIDISNLPDGNYWLRGQADPEDYFQQSGPSDSVTDTELNIVGTTVTVLQQVQPQLSRPVVTMTSPSPGPATNPTTLSATVSDSAPISSIQFVVDGQPVGAPVTSAPYTLVDNSLTPGSHQVSAQATDANGMVGTAPPVKIKVSGSISIGSMTIEAERNVTGSGPVTTNAFSASGGDVLLALVGSDATSSSTHSQSVKVSGAGLTWSLVRRERVSAGDVEIWGASDSHALSGAKVTSTPSQKGLDESLTVLAIKGAKGIGQSAGAGSSSGAPSVQLTSTSAGSAFFAVGNDWDTATARTLGDDQSMLYEWVDTATGDTYWSQMMDSTSTASGQAVTLDDTAPTSDQWNLAGVEVVPISSSSTSLTATDAAPQSDSTSQGNTARISSSTSPHSAVRIVSPTNGSTVSGTVSVTASSSMPAPVSRLQFFLDGNPLGTAVTSAGGSASWNTMTALNGSHTLTVTAVDTDHDRVTSSPVVVTVANASTCFTVDSNTVAHGSGPVTTSPFTTAESGELILALVGSDGGSAKQAVTVSGAGLRWSLVARENSSGGDAEIWEAVASNVLKNVQVTAEQAHSGYHEYLDVVSIQGTSGVGASAVAAAKSGAPAVSVTTTQPQSLVFGVGNDFGTAVRRTVGPNQVLLGQQLDTHSGTSFWSQNTSLQSGDAGSDVTLGDTAPTTDPWNFAAVEVLAAADAAYSTS